MSHCPGHRDRLCTQPGTPTLYLENLRAAVAELIPPHPEGGLEPQNADCCCPREGVLPLLPKHSSLGCPTANAAVWRGCWVCREAEASLEAPDKQGDTCRVTQEGAAQALVWFSLQQPRRGQNRGAGLAESISFLPLLSWKNSRALDPPRWSGEEMLRHIWAVIWVQDLQNALFLPVLGTSCEAEGPWGDWSMRC